VLLRYGRLLCVIVCIHLVGGQWALLQTAAWAGMLADYGSAYGIRKAVEMTFDGEHPCAMCRKIGEDRKRESKPDLPGGSIDKLAKKDPGFPSSAPLAVTDPVFTLLETQALHHVGESWREPPPLPVPETALA
jgi:hypothetical protein